MSLIKWYNITHKEVRNKIKKIIITVSLSLCRIPYVEVILLSNSESLQKSVSEDLQVENKEIENKDKQKICFIITPIGEVNTSIRRHIEGVIDSVIVPVLEQKEYEVKVAHREHGQGLITENIINCICDADIVIANLTNLNPNVMFEVALRYCTDKPIIHICEESTILPFDIKDQRTIFYKNDMLGVKELK